MNKLVRNALAAVLVAIGTTACTGVAPLQKVLLSPPQTARVSSQASSWQVRRVRVPEYLDNYDIQLRTDDYVLTRMSNAKWAERLPVAMTRLLQQAIDEKLVDNRGREYEVDVVVDAFEPRPSGQVVLVARWKVTQSKTETVVARDNTVIQQALSAEPRDAAAIGQAMSAAVRELAFEIVAKTG